MAVNKYINNKSRGSQTANRCGCLDSVGNPKRYYPSITEAKNAQNSVLQNNGIEVHIYGCPSGKGYHLTSQ